MKLPLLANIVGYHMALLLTDGTNSTKYKYPITLPLPNYVLIIPTKMNYPITIS